MNNIDKHLEFKLSEEEKNSINSLDLSVHRNTNSIDLGIYRKPTHTDITRQFSSNDPYEHKFAVFNFYVNRLLVLPITKQAKQQEWQIILAIAQNNGFPLHIIHNLKKKLIAKNQKQKLPTTTTQQPKKWVTFTYHSPAIRKITNLFKHTNFNIALRATNTIDRQSIKKSNLWNSEPMSARSTIAMMALCSGDFKLHSGTSSIMPCQLFIELHALEWVCLVHSAIFLQVDKWRTLRSNGFASDSVSNKEKLLRRLFRCCNRLMERIVWAVRNVTSGTSVSNRAERPSKTTPNLDGLPRQWTTITLRKCLLWFVKIAA